MVGGYFGGGRGGVQLYPTSRHRYQEVQLGSLDIWTTPVSVRIQEKGGQLSLLQNLK